MRNRFVPPSYQCDLSKKLQHLDQGIMNVYLSTFNDRVTRSDGTDHTRYRQRQDDRSGAYQKCLFRRFHRLQF
jgi:hypothetical protein